MVNGTLMNMFLHIQHAYLIYEPNLAEIREKTVHQKSMTVGDATEVFVVAQTCDHDRRHDVCQADTFS